MGVPDNNINKQPPISVSKETVVLTRQEVVEWLKTIEGLKRKLQCKISA